MMNAVMCGLVAGAMCLVALFSDWCVDLYLYPAKRHKLRRKWGCFFLIGEDSHYPVLNKQWPSSIDDYYTLRWQARKNRQLRIAIKKEEDEARLRKYDEIYDNSQMD